MYYIYKEQAYAQAYARIFQTQLRFSMEKLRT